MKKRSLTKIICTIGPKTASKKALKSLLVNGMSIARINFSHADYKSHKKVFKNIKEIGKKTKNHIGIAIDTKGPEVRTITTKPLYIKKGDCIKFVSPSLYHNLDAKDEPSFVVGLNLDDTAFLKENDILFIDDTKLEMRVVQSSRDYFVAEALNPYVLKDNKRIAFTSEHKEFTFLKDVDKSDILFGIKNGADIIFLSFVEEPEHVEDVRKLIRNDSIQVIAKIETMKGVDNVKEILKVADGIMIARGDLATNVGMRNMFGVQKKLSSIKTDKPIIMATEMMLSMTENSVPTRAETSDVGNAVLDGCDCVMLSSETATGNNPSKTVNMMRRICLNAESLTKDENSKLKYLEVNKKNIAKNRKYILKKGFYLQYKTKEKS